MSNDQLPDNQREWGEGSTPYLSVSLVDGAGVPIPLSNILTLTLTQWLDQGRGQPGIKINARNGQDVLNVHGVTISATTGLLTWQLMPADTAMQSLDPLVLKERHEFRFDLSYVSDSGAQYGTYPDFYFVVRRQVVR